MRTRTSGLSNVIPVVVGASLLVPILLVTTIVLMMNNNLDGKQTPNPAAQANPQAYAKSFYLIIRQQDGQNVHIWARNLDRQPDFRQTTEFNGQLVSHQIYVSAEKALYKSQQTTGQALKWNKTPNLEPSSVGIANITGGPAVWALQYGVGDKVVSLQQGNLNITVKSVSEPIEDTVFQPTDNLGL